MNTAFKPMAQRLVAAEERFLAYATEYCGLTRDEAERAMAFMTRGGKRAPLKLTVHGEMLFAHGVFAEPETIRRAATL